MKITIDLEQVKPLFFGGIVRMAESVEIIHKGTTLAKIDRIKTIGENIDLGTYAFPEGESEITMKLDFKTIQVSKSEREEIEKEIGK